MDGIGYCMLGSMSNLEGVDPILGVSNLLRGSWQAQATGFHLLSRQQLLIVMMLNL